MRLAAALLAGLLLPIAAQAQVHVSNAVSSNAFHTNITQGTSGETTIHLVQPFKTSVAAGADLGLENVVLHFPSMPLSSSQVKLYLYSAEDNPDTGQNKLFAPTIPDIGTYHSETLDLPANDAGRVLTFQSFTSLGGNRYQFSVPSPTTLDADTTYHLYLYSEAGVIGPTWRSVDITNSPGGTPGDAGFTGNTAQCGSGGWTYYRGIGIDPRNPNDFPPYSNAAFVTEIIGGADQSTSGTPSLTGTAQVGETLAAVTTAITDGNGLGTDPFSYQWVRVDPNVNNSREVIAGATSDTYTLTQDDAGSEVRVEVTVRDNDCYEVVVQSATSGLVPAQNAGGLTITGAEKVDGVLTAETGTITDPDGLTGVVYSYQWARVDADGTSNLVNIVGATAQTYEPIKEDQGKRLRVTVSFDDARGTAEEVDALSGVIARRDDAVATGLTLSGTRKVGEELTAETGGITDGNGLTGAVYTYLWERVDPDGSSNREEIVGETEQTYTLANEDAGRRIRVTVRFTDDDGYGERVDALTVTIVPADNEPATGLTISGAEKVDGVLTAEIGGITDANGTAGVQYTYQWARVDADSSLNPTILAGAITQTYTLVRADVGKRLRVTVSFADAAGFDEAPEAFSGVIAPRDNVVATGLTVSGTRKVHEELTAETGGITDGNGRTGAVYTYQWTRVDADGSANPTVLSREIAQTYELVDADLGRQLRVTVRFTDDDGHDEALVFLSGVINAPDPVAATGLVIDGEAMVRRTLTAQTGGIQDANGLSRAVYTYQWARVDADGSPNLEDIVGETAQAYTMADADLGKRMRVTVRFTDDDGYPEELSVTSGVVEEFRSVDENQVVEGALIRFGNTVTEHVLDGVRQRFNAPPAQGVEASFAGQRIAWGRDIGTWNPDGGTVMHGIQALTTRSAQDLLTGSTLLLSEENAGGGYTAVWARGAYESWSGKDGAIKHDGSVRTGQIGADRSSGAWIVGVSLAHSTGDSDYTTAEHETGTTETSLNGVYPYARYQFTERDSLWMAAGRSEGNLTLTPGGDQGAVKTNIGLTMGAVGAQVGMQGKRGHPADGIELAMNVDFAFVRMTSDEVAGRLSAASPNANRLRVGLEGSRRIEIADGATLIPSGEIGVRRDGGIVSPGTGAYVGAALVYIDPVRGLSFDLEGHSMVAHEVSDTREWGLSGKIRYEADQRTGEGLSWSLDGGFGAKQSGGMNALFAADEIENPGAADKDGPGERLNLDVGYGMHAFGNHFISRPSATLSLADSSSAWRLGWQVASAPIEPLNIRGGVNLSPRDGEYSVGLLVSARF